MSLHFIILYVRICENDQDKRKETVGLYLLRKII